MSKFRIRNTDTTGYWTVEEYISNEFCGAWHALFTSTHEQCTTYVQGR